MHLSLSTFLFGEKPLSYAIPEAARLGFCAVEVSHDLDLADAEIDELNHLRKQNDVTISSIHMPPERPAHPPGMAAHERLVEFAVAIGAGCAVTHLDEDLLAADGDAYVAGVARLTENARRAGLTYTIENARESLDDLERVVNAHPDTGFTFDIQHAAHHPDQAPNPFVYLEKFGSRLANIHTLAATRRVRGLGHGVPPGFEERAEVDWDQFAAILRDLKYDGPVTLEHNLSRVTQMLAVFLRMLKDTCTERTEMSLVPLTTEFGGGKLPKEILAQDCTPLKLVYDPSTVNNATADEMTLEHVLAAYSKQFFGRVFDIG